MVGAVEARAVKPKPSHKPGTPAFFVMQINLSQRFFDTPFGASLLMPIKLKVNKNPVILRPNDVKIEHWENGDYAVIYWEKSTLVFKVDNFKYDHDIVEIEMSGVNARKLYGFCC